MKKYLGEIGLTLTAIIWGSGFVATAIALEHYTAYQSMAVRFLIGGILLALIFYKKLKAITKTTLMKGSILGLILYLAFALQTVGLQFTTPSKNAFITAVNVVIVPLIGFIFYKKKIDRYELIGAILALIGIGFLSLQLTSAINLGDFLTFLCAIAFAFHIFYTARFVKHEDPISLTVIQMLTAAVIGWIAIGLKGELHMSLQKEGMLMLLYLGIFSTAIAFLLQTAAQKFMSETKAAIILATEALWGTIFSIIIIKEIITGRMIIGGTLIILAILLSETKLKFGKAEQVDSKQIS